ncbi:MAG TPA: hypothetical protein VMD30_08655 [Tepidisphaeraceae bacterium]|nr:hypothetical protein [Tepidisphaeraceae bacterium]
MDAILDGFTHAFQASFTPPIPRWNGSNWLISRVWSEYLRQWLLQHYQVTFEYPVERRGPLDAAIWSKIGSQNQGDGKMEIALEWEWDNNKAAHFLSGDFQKCLEARALCGLAVKQTRADGNRGATQADETVGGLYECCKGWVKDGRALALIEFRRVAQSSKHVEFTTYLHDLKACSKRPLIAPLRYNMPALPPSGGRDF